MKPIIQIAGILDLDEATWLYQNGANCLGFPLRLKDGREDLTEERARDIIAALKGKVDTVLITYQDSAAEIMAFSAYLGVTGVQLHGDISTDQLASLRRERADLFLIRSLVVRSGGEAELQALAAELHPYVDALVADTCDPEWGRSGATGGLRDWSISRHLVGVSSKPVILAGDLTPENVYASIQEVQPAGVAVHTGVENQWGRKDPWLYQHFIAEAIAAYRHLSP